MINIIEKAPFEKSIKRVASVLTTSEGGVEGAYARAYAMFKVPRVADTLLRRNVLQYPRFNEVLKCLEWCYFNE